MDKMENVFSFKGIRVYGIFKEGKYSGGYLAFLEEMWGVIRV